MAPGFKLVLALLLSVDGFGGHFAPNDGLDVPVWVSSFGVEGYFSSEAATSGKLVSNTTEALPGRKLTRQFVRTEDPMLYAVFKSSPCEANVGHGPDCVDGKATSEHPVSCVVTYTGGWWLLCNDLDDIGIKLYTPVAWDADGYVTAMRHSSIETGPVYALEDGRENTYHHADVGHYYYTRDT